jgi:hypothetical protein
LTYQDLAQTTEILGNNHLNQARMRAHEKHYRSTHFRGALRCYRSGMIRPKSHGNESHSDETSVEVWADFLNASGD